MKLTQVIALEKGMKSQEYSFRSEVNKLLQKPELFTGLEKKYRKKNEEAEDLPGEFKKVTHHVEELLSDALKKFSELLSVTAQRDYTNQDAKADIVVDGVIVVPSVPVSYLLFLEKQLVDFRTLFNNIPVLSEQENWIKHEGSNQYKSDVTTTQRTQKVHTPIVKYHATPEHPAQTDLVVMDITVGYWDTTKFSSAVPVSRKKELLERVEKLLQATKVAREEANLREVKLKEKVVGDLLVNYLRG